MLRARQDIESDNEFVTRQQDCDITQTICNYKFVHFKLYAVADQITDIFGWSLISVLIETFVENAYMMFWVFCYLYRGDNSESLTILSNY